MTDQAVSIAYCQFCSKSLNGVFVAQEGFLQCPHCGVWDSEVHLYQYCVIEGRVIVDRTISTKLEDGQIIMNRDPSIVMSKSEEDAWVKEQGEKLFQGTRDYQRRLIEKQTEQRRQERLQMTKTCSRCGRVFQIDHVFCYYCGYCFECEEEYLPRTCDRWAEHYSCHASADTSDDDD